MIETKFRIGVTSGEEEVGVHRGAVIYKIFSFLHWVHGCFVILFLINVWCFHLKIELPKNIFYDWGSVCKASGTKKGVQKR